LEALKPILSLVEQRERILEEKREFESSSSDPNRLLSKAGRDPGRLLREEKFRKVISRDLPKLEMKLHKAILDWEEANQEDFIYGEGRYLDQIEFQQEERKSKEAISEITPVKYIKSEQPKSSSKKPISSTPKLRTMYTVGSSPYRCPTVVAEKYNTNRIPLSPIINILDFVQK